MTPSLLIPTADPTVFDLHFDNSSMENFNTCSRKAQYHSVFKRKPAGFNTAHYFGGVAHECLELRKQAQMLRQADPLLYAISAPKWEHEQAKLVIDRFEKQPMPPDEWRTADNLIRLLHAYNDQYPLDLEPFSILPGTVELPFCIKIGEMHVNSKVELRPGEFLDVSTLNVFWTGRIDGIIEIDGSLMILDHKTASVIGPSYFEDYELSAQMHGYNWAGRQLGYNTVGLYLDVLGNRMPTKTGKAIDLRRQRFFYNDEHIEEWRNDVFTSLSDFVEYLVRGYFPKETPTHCHGKFGTCQYWGVCTLLPTQRQGALFGDTFTDDTWSPLHIRHEQEVVA